MSPQENAKEHEWWVEERGFQKEARRHQDVHDAKERLWDVLRYYMQDEVPNLYDGNWVKMTCPFHDDRHPSAAATSLYFRCFACGVSGDAIDLVMGEEGFSFRRAVEFINQL